MRYLLQFLCWIILIIVVTEDKVTGNVIHQVQVPVTLLSTHQTETLSLSWSEGEGTYGINHANILYFI